MARPLRATLRSIAIAAFVGIVIASIYGIGLGEFPFGILLSGALIGIAIFFIIRALDLFLLRRIGYLPRPVMALVRTLVYAIGGATGWVVGLSTSLLILGHPVSLGSVIGGTGKMFMIVSGAIAILVGISVSTFEILNERLRAAVEKLKEREWAEKELELARGIQTRLLPPPLLEGDGFTIAARNLAAHFVAGDFYDIVPLDDGSIVVVVADVAGKGFGASLIMASVKAVLPFVARQPAANAMRTLNEKLVQELGKREFVALAFARYQPADGRVELLNAGFPDPYVVGRDGVRALVASGPRVPLGIRRELEYETLGATIAPGERLVFVSDGIPEAPVDGEPLGYERLEGMLASLDGATRGEAWLDAFLARVRAEAGEGLEDDWTAVVVERRQ